MNDIPLSEEVNRETPPPEGPKEFPLSTEQLFRLEAIAAQMMEPVLGQVKSELDLEQAAVIAVELAFHVMNKARDCRINESFRFKWRDVNG